jgi:hypothetical protein
MKRTPLLLAIVIALLAALGYVLFWPGKKLERGLVEALAAMTGAEVTVGDVSWSRESDLFVVSALVIRNPPGFAAGPAMEVPVVEISARRDALEHSPILVQRIVLSGPRLHYASGPEGSNIEAIEKAIKAYTPPDDARRYIVTQLSVREPRALLATAGGEPREADLLSFYQEDAGKDRGGIGQRELALVVVTQLRQRLAIVLGIEGIRSGIKSLLGD